MRSEDAQFVGSIPAVYDAHLGPVLFEVHAKDLAARVPTTPGLRVLEVACGTGIVTRHLLARLPSDARLVSTDLNAPMIEHARTVLPPDARLELRTADAQVLPFADASFDVYVCQYGVMFFPDKALALREAKRVLKPGGLLLFNVWRPMAENPYAVQANDTARRWFPENPPRFYEVPFSWGEPAPILAALTEAGFHDASTEPLQRQVKPQSPEHFARGLVLGNPFALELKERGVADPTRLVGELAEAIATSLASSEGCVVMNTLVVRAVA